MRTVKRDTGKDRTNETETLRAVLAQHLFAALELLFRDVESLDDPIAQPGSDEDEYEHAEECPGGGGEVRLERRKIEEEADRNGESPADHRNDGNNEMIGHGVKPLRRFECRLRFRIAVGAAGPSRPGGAR